MTNAPDTLWYVILEASNGDCFGPFEGFKTASDWFTEHLGADCEADIIPLISPEGDHH